MASNPRAPVTVSYRKRGLRPPVYVAGTFSEPEWELQEMHCLSDDSGENHFTIQIMVDAGKEYQYKFKVGDDWELDEHATIVNAGEGKHVNLLRVPMTSSSADRSRTPLVEATEREGDGTSAPGQPGLVASGPKSLLPNIFKGNAGESAENRSRTPIKQVADTAAEVADTAAKLDNLDVSQPYMIPEPSSKNRRDLTIETMAPLFAHESLGAYDFVDDGLNHDTIDKMSKSPTSLLSESVGSLDDLDLGDPTLEKFPSNRDSVMETLRKIQSGSSIDDTLSPATSRRESIDSLDGTGGQLSPTSTRKRENRTSRGSFGRPKSAVSLGAIAEEPKAPGERGANAKQSAVARKTGEQSDEDTGLMMKHTRA